jgi:hypothetical protein
MQLIIAIAVFVLIGWEADRFIGRYKRYMSSTTPEQRAQLSRQNLEARGKNPDKEWTNKQWGVVFIVAIVLLIFGFSTVH